MYLWWNATNALGFNYLSYKNTYKAIKCFAGHLNTNVVRFICKIEIGKKSKEIKSEVDHPSFGK